VAPAVGAATEPLLVHRLVLLGGLGAGVAVVVAAAEPAAAAVAMAVR
jgi:hypothetical protein